MLLPPLYFPPNYHKIVAVSENVQEHDVYRKTFGPYNVDLLLTQNVESFKDRLGEALPSLVIMDQHFFEKGSDFLINHIGRETHSRVIPIILTTRRPPGKLAEELRNRGVRACVYRPVKESTLLAAAMDLLPLWLC